MGNDKFFDEAKDQSLVKATIVSKYFLGMGKGNYAHGKEAWWQSSLY
jgi:hypothetical protein